MHRQHMTPRPVVAFCCIHRNTPVIWRPMPCLRPGLTPPCSCSWGRKDPGCSGSQSRKAPQGPKARIRGVISRPSLFSPAHGSFGILVLLPSITAFLADQRCHHHSRRPSHPVNQAPALQSIVNSQHTLHDSMQPLFSRSPHLPPCVSTPPGHGFGQVCASMHILPTRVLLAAALRVLSHTRVHCTAHDTVRLWLVG